LLLATDGIWKLVGEQLSFLPQSPYRVYSCGATGRPETGLKTGKQKDQ